MQRKGLKLERKTSCVRARDKPDGRRFRDYEIDNDGGWNPFDDDVLSYV